MDQQEKTGRRTASRAGLALLAAVMAGAVPAGALRRACRG